MNIKLYLDELVDKYECSGFVKNDPVRFPRSFVNKNDIEIAAFLSSLFAYGKRELFISKLEVLFELMNGMPYEFVMNFDEDNKLLDDFSYRFSVGVDIVQIVLILKMLYKSGESLETLFDAGWTRFNDVQKMLQYVVDYFYCRVTLPVTKGFYHLLPNPSNGSACKRLNMFLRWMIRDGIVDLGLWNFMSKSDLLIPLDVHVARISRSLGLLSRKQNDFLSVIELTQNLGELDSVDPVKYDFAMFGYGVNNNL